MIYRYASAFNHANGYFDNDYGKNDTQPCILIKNNGMCENKVSQEWFTFNEVPQPI